MVRFAALFLSCLALAAPAVAQDDSMRLGGHVEITDTVKGSLHAAGGLITVDAPVEGDASLAGGAIIVKGAIKQDLHAAGGHVRIDGEIGGDATIAAGTLELGPDARIAGKLSFEGGELMRDPAAVVGGTIETNARRYDYLSDGPYAAYASGWLWTTSLLVLAALIAAALPGPSKRMALELRERPWLTALAGMVAITMIPLVAMLLMVTIIGIPFGLLTMVGYAALLLVGYVWLAVVVGSLLLDRARPETAALTAWRAGAAVLAMLVLALLTRLPFVGGLVVFTALVVGVGMVVAVVMRAATPATSVPA